LDIEVSAHRTLPLTHFKCLICLVTGEIGGGGGRRKGNKEEETSPPLSASAAEPPPTYYYYYCYYYYYYYHYSYVPMLCESVLLGEDTDSLNTKLCAGSHNPI